MFLTEREESDEEMDYLVSSPSRFAKPTAVSVPKYTYKGRDMKSSHAGMSITGEEFDALVGDLATTLNNFKVGDRDKNELLGALGPMKKDIVISPMASGSDDAVALPLDHHDEYSQTRAKM